MNIIGLSFDNEFDLINELNSVQKIVRSLSVHPLDGHLISIIRMQRHRRSGYRNTCTGDCTLVKRMNMQGSPA